MTPSKLITLSLAFLALQSAKCQNTDSKEVLSKIEFDYTAVDDKGLVSSDVSLDYEFCIPQDDKMLEQVRAIEPDVQTPRMAKGRIGCSADEWLCIVSTNGPRWKEKLYAIASLPFVKRIVQTDYE